MHLLGLQQVLPQSSYRSLTQSLPLLRAIKDDNELIRLAAAGAAADSAYEELRDPDVRLHRNSLRHDRLGLLAAADRSCTRCRICLICDHPESLRRGCGGCADRAAGVRTGLYRTHWG